jgi:hypothetical protein
MKGGRRRDGGGGLLWFVLPLILFVVLKTDILPQLARCKWWIDCGFISLNPTVMFFSPLF